MQTAAVEAVDPRHAGIAAGVCSSGRYAGSIVAALLLAALLGDGSEHAQSFFAVTTAAAAAAALLTLRLGGAGPRRAAVEAVRA